MGFGTFSAHHRMPIRTIGIDEETARVLREHLERSEELARKLGDEKLPPGAYVFWPYNEGPLVPYAPQSITNLFRTLPAKVGCGRISCATSRLHSSLPLASRRSK